MDLGAAGYAAAFTVALLLSGLLTPLVLRVAVRRDALDRPDEAHKSHDSPVPYLGGLAIAAGFTISIGAATLLAPPANVAEVLVLLGLALGLAVVGLIDDLRGLSAGVRFAAQIAAGFGVWAVGAGTTLMGSEAANLAVTVVWVVGITNAFNLLDNMDGLSAGVAMIAALAFLGIAAANGQFLVAALSAALAGVAAGFLWHNAHPAKIYMGDAGSLFLGFLLAVIGVRLRLVDTPQLLSAFVPILVLGVAIFDTTLVTVDRLRRGVSPLKGGQDHTSHRLVALGLPVPAAIAVIYGVAVALGWAGAAIAAVRVVLAYGLLASSALLLAFAFVALLALPGLSAPQQSEKIE